MSRPSNRQELYNRIRGSSKDEVIIDEMIRTGFWKQGQGETSVPEELIRRRGELQREIAQLARDKARFQNREDALKAIRAERLAESRRKQKENKARRETDRIERSAAWERRKQSEILFLGEEYSSSLGNFEGNPERLAKHDLPSFANHLALAQSMALSVSELRFLTYTRKVSRHTHYKRFFIAKKTGGQRLISAPMPRLKQAQHWILNQVLDKVALHSGAHGFRHERNILSNAAPHANRGLVINLDLKDFFPSVSYPRVWGIFRSLGYSPSVSTIFALLCSEPDIEEVELDGTKWYIATSERHLPQGAPTSPALTNILCRRFDARLTGVANKHDFRYTRYADDLTFSAEDASPETIKKLFWHIRAIIREEGFQEHPDKTRLMRKGRRQEVTGLTVNSQLSVPREKVRAFRALLHHLETKGLNGATWQGSSHRLLARMRGYAAFLLMVDRTRFGPVAAKATSLAKSLGYQHEIRHPRREVAPPTQSSASSGPPPIPGAAPKPPLPNTKTESGGLWSKIRKMFGGE